MRATLTPASRLTQSRELTLHADRWTDALGIDSSVISALLAQVDGDVLDNLNTATDPAASVDVYVADDRVSMFLGDARIAVLPREPRR